MNKSFNDDLDQMFQMLSEFNEQLKELRQDNRLVNDQQRMLCEQIQTQVIQLQDRQNETSARRNMVERILLATALLDLTSVVTEELARAKIVPNTRDCVHFIREGVTNFKIKIPERPDQDISDYQKYLLATTTAPPEQNQETVSNVV
ncbi:hypothetical protein Pan153_23920 [Gimesia panareensis]|uniref:Uncharacterized protein n=2 Tax=Gimesia panareensis TaxID=2527978 RepID=A0A518FN45_9PLAN|nr:hypothetical protein Pan153_23920 [Gimesia panareensis]